MAKGITTFDESTGITRSDKVSGIYKIENKVNNKIYIGQSVNVFKRVNVHRTNLKRNVHQNSHLQLSWNKYGEESFSFSIIEFCDENSLNMKEYEWIEKYNSTSKNCGYNHMKPDKDSKKFRHSQKTKEKMKKRAKYTEDELLSYLEEFFYMEGRLYDIEDDKNPKFSGYPNIGYYTTKFGGIGKAIELLGLQNYDPKASHRCREIYTKEKIARKAEKYISEYGLFPESECFGRRGYDLPSYYAIKKFYRTIEELRSEFNIPTRRLTEQEKTKAINKLVKILMKNEPLTEENVKTKKRMPFPRFYSLHFGSFNTAVKLAYEEYEKIVLNNKLLDKSGEKNEW